jgi:hypothetical protein
LIYRLKYTPLRKKEISRLIVELSNELLPLKYTLEKGGEKMAGLWVTTIGFVICLGIVGGTLVYFLRGALHSEDSTRIDQVKSENDE